MTDGSPPSDRRGEKSGWLAGWLGGFVWVGLLAVVFLVQGRWLAGAIGLGLLLAAVGVVVATAPWRHPSTPYWKLMLPVYLCLALALVWLLRAYDGPTGLGLNPWQLLAVLPVLLPFWLAGQRRWEDSPPASQR